MQYMSALHRLLICLGILSDSSTHQYQQTTSFQNLITKLAQQQNRSEEDVHADLLADALAKQDTSRTLWKCWQSLSPREQDVAAFTCLGYTNNEIAIRLGISHTTIKSHIRNILIKFQMHGKAELRLALQEWDFTEWERTRHI